MSMEESVLRSPIRLACPLAHDDHLLYLQNRIIKREWAYDSIIRHSYSIGTRIKGVRTDNESYKLK